MRDILVAVFVVFVFAGCVKGEYVLTPKADGSMLVRYTATVADRAKFDTFKLMMENKDDFFTCKKNNIEFEFDGVTRTNCVSSDDGYAISEEYLISPESNIGTFVENGKIVIDFKKYIPSKNLKNIKEASFGLAMLKQSGFSASLTVNSDFKIEKILGKEIALKTKATEDITDRLLDDELKVVLIASTATLDVYEKLQSSKDEILDALAHGLVQELHTQEESVDENVADGTVKTTTNYWQDNADVIGSKLSHKEAVLYCENLKLGALKGWRLPTIYELASTHAIDLFNPSIEDMFVFYDTSNGGWYWSSDRFAGDASFIWVMDDKYGISSLKNKKEKLNVRCILDK